MEQQSNTKGTIYMKYKAKITIRGISKRPRVSVFRSNKFLYLQLIDDEKHETLFGLSQKNVSKEKNVPAKELGILFAKKIHDKKITRIVFDKGRYAYHGKIKAVAEGLREGGLDF